MSAKTRKRKQALSTPPATQLREDKHSLLFWAIAGFVTLFLLIAPFQKGLFNGTQPVFNRPIYESIAWTAAAMFLLAIYLFYRWKLNDTRDAWHLTIWLIPLSFLISLIPALSSTSAALSLHIHIQYACFFIVGVYLARHKFGADLLQGSLMASGFVIVMFGFMNWFGNASPFGWINYSPIAGQSSSVYINAVLVDSNGPRLTSVFQYANSYAVYLIALVLSCLFLLTMSKKWYVALLSAFMLVPGIISLILTLSRGGLVVFPVILLIVLPFLTLSRQIVFFIQFVLAMLAALLISGKINDMGLSLQKDFSNPQAWKAWALLLGVSILCTLISLPIRRYLEPRLTSGLNKFSRKRFSRFTVPVIGLVLGAIGLFLLFGDTGLTHLLPNEVKQRVENINFQQHSVLERIAFYKDGMKAFRDYPVFGAGGGAWAATYEQYQSNPYLSNQAHNFFLQYLIETGLFGFLSLLLLLCLVFYKYIRAFIRSDDESGRPRFIFFIFAISILVHSVIDFNLSYVYLGAIVFLCLGGMLSGAATRELPLAYNHPLRRWSKVYPALIAALSLILFIVSLQIAHSVSLFNQANAEVQQKKPLNSILDKLDRAISISPSPYYIAQKTALLRQAYQQTKEQTYYDQAMQALQKLKKNDPHSRQYLENRYALELEGGHPAQALEVINQALGYYPWDITMYDRAISLHFQLGAQATQAEQGAEKDRHWDAALRLLATVGEKTKELEKLPEQQGQGRAFNVTTNMALAAGQIYYSRGEFAAAANVLKPRINPALEQEQDRAAARWYLAALRKQSKDDPALYQTLIAKDPAEKDKLEQLANAKLDSK